MDVEIGCGDCLYFYVSKGNFGADNSIVLINFVYTLTIDVNI